MLRFLVVFGATMAKGFSLFVIADAHLHELVVERLDVAERGLAGALEFPGGDVAELLVVTLALAVGILVLLAEMAAATLLARERVEAHQLAEFEEVGHAAGLLERLVERVGAAGHE